MSASNREKVIAYIDNQEKHHRKLTFEEEFLAFLEPAGVDYDPRFVFDKEKSCRPSGTVKTFVFG